MKFNPVAIALWLFCSCIGYLIGGTNGAVMGLTLGLGITLMASIL